MEIKIFKEYIDKYGADFSQTTEFLSFYALSYVENPITHSSFSNLFTEEWIKEREKILVKFMKKQFPERQISRIEKIVNFYQKYSKIEISELWSKNESGIELPSAIGNDETNTFSREKSQILLDKDISKEKSIAITTPNHIEEEVQNLKENYSNIKEVSVGLLKCMKKIVESLSQKDHEQRGKIKKWAKKKLNSYCDELQEIENEFSREGLELNESEEQEEEKRSEMYSEKQINPNKEFGRATLDLGKRKILKIECEDMLSSSHRNLGSNNWMDNMDEKSSNQRRNPEVQHELEMHVSPKQLKEITKDEIEVDKKEQDKISEEYEDDFEEYNTEEDNKTEKELETQKLAYTTEFSLLDINYDKIRGDLSDYSLLLLKNTATSDGVNRKGILEKKT